METLFTAYRKSGDWKVFVDRAKAGPLWWRSQQAVLPPLFVAHWLSLQGQNQRGKSRSQWFKLLNQYQRWRNGDKDAAIPGYDIPPKSNPMTDYPDGWSYENLMRYKPTKYEANLIQIGPKSAAKFRPLNHKTRFGLEVGEIIAPDDFKHDFKIIAPGAAGSCELYQFHFIDIASAYHMDRGFKPIIENDLTGVREHLREREMLFLLCHLFHTIGYRRDGCTIYCEAGTARIREREADLLYKLTNGKIYVQVGATSDAPAFAGFFKGVSGGNPRFKAALESSGNLIHNREADMIDFPGQTGSNSRINRPEELAGREDSAKMWITACKALDPETAAKLRTDFLRLDEAIWAVNRMMDAINRREDHELEGWLECGYYKEIWRERPELPWRPWQDFLRLSPKDQAIIGPMLNTMPGLKTSCPMSPHEVFHRASKNFAKLTEADCAMILGGLEPTPVTVQDNSEIVIKNAEIAPGRRLIYSPIVRDQNGGERFLRPGSEWHSRVNLYDASKMFLYDQDGGYIGACPLVVPAAHNSVDDLEREYKRVAHAQAELLKGAKAIGANITRQAIRNAEHNAAILGGVQKQKEESKARALAMDASLYADADK